VLTIDSSWGTGKTTFLKMWSAYLEHEQFNILAFNAWENDFSEDPLISFIGEMKSAFEKLNEGNNTKLSKAIKKTTEIGGKLLRSALPVAAKLATYGLLDLDRAVEGAIAESASKIISKKISNYEADKKSFDDFKLSLTELVSVLPSHDKNKPLVFFIDELDRCRPSYAVELLERIKHLFTVPGIVFVLAIDKSQLVSSIKMLYGSDMDTEGYLRRFIDIEYKLPKPNPKDYPLFLAETHQLEATFANKHGGTPDQNVQMILESFVHISEIFHLTLRDQEKCFAYLDIYIKISKKDHLGPLPLVVALIIIKLGDPKLYQRYLDDRKASDEILSQLKSSDIFHSKYFGIAILAYINYSKFNTRELMDKMRNLSVNIEQLEQASPARREQRIQYETLDKMSEYPGLIDDLIKKIELGDRFKN